MGLCAAVMVGGCKKDGSGAGGGETAAPPKREAHKARDGDVPIKLAFVTNNSSDFWNIAQKGIEKLSRS